MPRPFGSLSSTINRQALAVGILAAVIFGLVWGLQQKPRPLPPTSDLYTHLSVARHLVRQEGYLSDVAYPLSFAFPFARQLPQPLIHRMPGFGTVLVLPYLWAKGDPAGTVSAVRLLQILLVLLMIAYGAYQMWRLGYGVGIPFWLILLGTLPLLGYAVAWGNDEVLVGLLLLVIWLNLRGDSIPAPLFVGALTGLLAMVRLELFWLPVIWWLFLAPRQTSDEQSPQHFSPAFWLMFAAATAVLIPWSLRTLSLTGQPFFTLQAVAEHAKDTRTFPGYSVYQGLEPQTLTHTLLSDPIPLARKTMRGIEFYFNNLPRFLPWPWLLVLAAAPLKSWVNRLRSLPPDRRSPTKLDLATATTLALIFFYSPFDHSLRHLLPVLPLLTWELAAFAAGPLPTSNAREALRKTAILTSVAGLTALVFPCHLPGWDHAALDAKRQQPEVIRAAAAFKIAPTDDIFVASSAIPWLADRPGVWTPPDPAIRAAIKTLLTEQP